MPITKNLNPTYKIGLTESVPNFVKVEFGAARKTDNRPTKNHL
jgi:hypothetical protein